MRLRPDGLDCGVGSFGVGVAFIDAVGVGVAVGVLFGVGVLVGVRVLVGVAVVVGVGVCIGEGEGCASFSSLKPPSPPSPKDMSCSCWSSWAGSAFCSSELAGSGAANCICCAGESGSAGDVLPAGVIACSASCRRFCEVCVLAAEALVFSLLSGALSLPLPVSRRGFCLGEGVFIVTSSSLTGTPTATATPRASALADVA